MAGEDASKVQVVSRLTIDAKDAVKGVHDLGAAFRTLNQDVKTVESLLQKTVPNLLGSLDNYVLRSTASLEQALQGRVKTLRDLANELSRAAARSGALVDQYGKPLSLAGVAGAGDVAKQIQLAQERSAKAAAAMLPKLEAQLALTQRRIREEGLSGSQLASQAAIIREQVKALQEKLRVSGKLSNVEVQQVHALQQQTAALRSQLTILKADKLDLPGKRGAEFLESALARRLGWFATGAGVFGITNAVRTGLSTVTAMETQMTTLSRVMNDQAYSADRMRKELTALGEEYGHTFDVVSDIAVRWAQSGKNMQETLEATRATLLALNTAEMDAKSGTESLLGIMSQWGMQASELVDVIDQLNLVADRNNVTTQDLVDGLLRSGAAARNAGLSFKENIALLTAMREASGRAGAEVGNALNSILTFMTREKSLKTFEQAGIAVFADETREKLRPLIDILSDIAANWNSVSDAAKDALAAEAESAGLFSEEMAQAIGAQATWNDLQKRDISNAAAAAYRRNYLLALLGNFTKLQEVLNELEEAHGYSLKENERAMTTYQRKVEQLKASLEDVAYQFATEGGVLDGLKAAVDGLRAGVQAWSDLDDATQAAVLSMAGVGGALTALNAGLTRLAQVNLAGAIAAMTNYIRTAGMAAAATRALSALTATVFSPTGLLILGGSLLAGGIAYTRTLAKEAEQQRRDAQRQAEELERLRDRYLALAQQTELTAEEQQELHSVSQQLVDLMPELAAKFDTAGNAILNVGEVAEQTARKIKALREDAQRLIEEEAAVGRARLPALEEQLETLERLYNKYRTAVLEGPQAVRRVGSPHFEQNLIIPLLPDDMVMKMAEKWLEEYREQIANVTAEIERYRAAVVAAENTTLSSGGGGRWKPKDTSTTVNRSRGGTATDQAKLMAEAILAEVRALEELGAETEREISLREARIAYLTREGATLDELNRADRDRAELLSLLTQRQQELAQQAREARAAIERLRSVQASLNTATDEGKAAHEHLNREIERLVQMAGTAENPIGQLSVEWWKLERQKADLQRENNAISRTTLERLAELETAYSKGVLSLEDYVTALGSLSAQAGLTKEALESLQEAQAKVQAELWNQRLDQALEDGRKALEAYSKAVDEVFEGYQRGARERSLEELVAKLKDTSDTIRSLVNGTGRQEGVPAALPDGLSTEAAAAAQSALSLIDRIMRGAFSANRESLLSLDRDAFLSAVTTAIRDLEAAGIEVNEAISAIAKDRADVLAGLKASADTIRGALSEFDQTSKQLERGDTLQRLWASIDALRGYAPVNLPIPDAGDLERLAQSVDDLMRVDDLGKLEPDAFASILRDNMASLREASRTVQEWTRAASEGISLEIASIDEEISRIDRRLQERLADLQAQLDALDREERQDERAKAEEEYNKRIQALQEEREWILLQNEEDAAFRLAAIDKQLAEERAKWSEQLTQWQREDQRQRIRDQMEAARAEAEERKRSLEEQRAALQEQQRLLTQALQALADYVSGEQQYLRDLAQERLADIASRQDELEERYGILQQALSDINSYVEAELAEWQRLADERKSIERDVWDNEEDGIRKLMQDGITTTLAEMAARDPEWRARGEATMEALIEGIRSKQGELRAEINEAMRLLDELRAASAAAHLGNLPSASSPSLTVVGMAEGAYVKGGRGGVLSLIGEGRHDEIVFPVPKITPIMADAMRQVMAAGSGLASMSPQALTSMMEAAFRRVVEAMPPAEVVTMVDGEIIDRRVVRIFSGLTPHVRTS